MARSWFTGQERATERAVSLSPAPPTPTSTPHLAAGPLAGEQRRQGLAAQRGQHWCSAGWQQRPLGGLPWARMKLLTPAFWRKH